MKETQKTDQKAKKTIDQSTANYKKVEHLNFRFDEHNKRYSKK